MGCVAVIGLGLMGGSLARELSAAGERVLGFDRDPATVEAALSAGALQAPLTGALDGARDADLLVVAVPVTAARDVLATALPHLKADTVVTDLGSTKRAVIRAAEELGLGDRFVGSHPLAGDHRAGWHASRSGLFRGARVYLTPTRHTAPAALARVAGLWDSLGGVCHTLDAEAHDRLLAWTSHLPQAVATATANTLADAGVPRAELGPGGRDVTRLAGSSAEMWTAVSRENADYLAEAVGALEAQLAHFREALRTGDEAAMRSFFAAGGTWAGAEAEK